MIDGCIALKGPAITNAMCSIYLARAGTAFLKPSTQHELVDEGGLLERLAAVILSHQRQANVLQDVGATSA